MSEPVYPYYLDASAVVRLVVDEPGSKDLRKYFDATPNACIALVSFFEALGVMKRKWQNKWGESDYHDAVKCLLQMMYGGKPEVDNMALADPFTFKSLRQIAEQQNLDFADAFQLFAILNGKYAPFASGSKTRFISADKDLVRAARSKGISTWNCSRDGEPNWA
jgi:predicted nucleic acid-binding protein